jgi:HD superfamily phosphohydrolase YqeK
MIDYIVAKKAFEEYINTYDKTDSKIELKRIHTFGVVACTKVFTESLNISKEEMEVAKIIALLHDIGRFEQVTKFGTFEDYKTLDHGAYGVNILFGTTMMIRNFIKEDTYDEVIKKAKS